MPDNSTERWDKKLFQWNSDENDGIYGKNARDIEAKAYKAEFILQLRAKRIQDDIERRMGEFEERIGRMENHDPEKLPVLDEEELTIRERQADYMAKAKEMVNREGAQERVMHWRNEFIELYGDEP